MHGRHHADGRYRPAVGLLPPGAPLTDGTVVLRPIDDRDLPVLERAARDCEIARRFGLAKLPPREYLDAYSMALRAGSGAAFAIDDPGGACFGQVVIEVRDSGRADVGYWLFPRDADADAPRRRSSCSPDGRSHSPASPACSSGRFPRTSRRSASRSEAVFSERAFCARTPRSTAAGSTPSSTRSFRAISARSLVRRPSRAGTPARSRRGCRRAPPARCPPRGRCGGP
jgi:hypothetical protein